MRAGAYPYLVVIGDVMPNLAGKIFVLQFDAKTGDPLGRYISPPYELACWQLTGVNRWLLRAAVNGGLNVVYTSEPFDGWPGEPLGSEPCGGLTFKDPLGRAVPIRFRAFHPKVRQTVDPASVAPATPEDVINLETPSPKPDASLASMVLGALQKQNKTMSGLLQKADRTLEETKSMVTGVLKHVHEQHEEHGAAVSKEMGELRSDFQGNLEAVREDQEQLARRVEQHDNDVWTQSEKLSMVDARADAQGEKMDAMQEELHALKRQLSTGADGNHIHYHDQRVVIVVQHLEIDLRALPTPVELFWYNWRQKGCKYTRVFLPAQEPKYTATGEITVDLLHNASDNTPSILDIFPRNLVLPHDGPRRKRQRHW